MDQHRKAKAFLASGSNGFPRITKQIMAIMAIFLQLATFCMALVILPLGIMLGSWLFAMFAIFLIASSTIGIKIALQAWGKTDIFGPKWPKKEGDQKQWTIK